MQRICVYCGSSTKVNNIYFEAAEKLGKAMATNNIELIYGGGAVGLMGKLADTIIQQGGHVTGIIPQFMCEHEWNHNGITQLIITETMHERKEKMAALADAAVALPGGCGTFEELLEIITWKQLGIFSKPIVIVNIQGYYDPLIALLDRAIEQLFMRDLHKNIWIEVTDASLVLEAINNAPKWDANIRKLAQV